MEQGQYRPKIEEVTDPWYRYFIQYDPAPALRQVEGPVLALYGSKDVQVPADQNAGPMRRALRRSPSDDAPVRVVDGVNPLFQPAETELPDEYSQIDTTMSQDVLQTVSGWIAERTR